jgi:predicted nucleotidyltransferase
MPNGHRQHFRISLEEGWEERDERDGTPSPIHSSDSEDTDVNKYRWVLLAKRVLRRWRIFLTAARRRRAYSYLEGLRLLQDLPSEEVQRVAKYMKHK